MDSERIDRKELRALLLGHNAHLPVEKTLKEFPLEHINARLPGVEYTPWQLLEHMRIAQWDILEFINNPDYVAPKWPDGYWPSKETEATEEMWKSTVENLLSDLRSADDLLKDPDTDLYAPLPYAPDYTMFREMILIADHNAYHLGQLVLMKKCLM